jgi:hypothetical protein
MSAGAPIVLWSRGRSDDKDFPGGDGDERRTGKFLKRCAELKRYRGQ